MSSLYLGRNLANPDRLPLSPPPPQPRRDFPTPKRCPFQPGCNAKLFLAVGPRRWAQTCDFALNSELSAYSYRLILRDPAISAFFLEARGFSKVHIWMIYQCTEAGRTSCEQGQTSTYSLLSRRIAEPDVEALDLHANAERFANARVKCDDDACCKCHHTAVRISPSHPSDAHNTTSRCGPTS